jgi:hypothetical protein
MYFRAAAPGWESIPLRQVNPDTRVAGLAPTPILMSQPRRLCPWSGFVSPDGEIPMREAWAWPFRPVRAYHGRAMALGAAPSGWRIQGNNRCAW